mmetsp:Transcript_96317/g.267668  ORF Transcript_96317/g.267668 Transcript_96317/m.267668 type:complete len:201 (-) Transcript_96317:22-624(-)
MATSAVPAFKPTLSTGPPSVLQLGCQGLQLRQELLRTHPLGAFPVNGDELHADPHASALRVAALMHEAHHDEGLRRVRLETKAQSPLAKRDRGLAALVDEGQCQPVFNGCLGRLGDLLLRGLALLWRLRALGDGRGGVLRQWWRALGAARRERRHGLQAVHLARDLCVFGGIAATDGAEPEHRGVGRPGKKNHEFASCAP